MNLPFLFNYSGDSVTECYGEYFDQTYCFGETFMEVQMVYYGLNDPAIPTKIVYYGLNDPAIPTNCYLNTKCPQDLSILNPTHYQAILDACNGNPDCGDLRADRDRLPDECGLGVYSNYVEIDFKCVTGGFIILEIMFKGCNVHNDT